MWETKKRCWIIPFNRILTQKLTGSILGRPPLSVMEMCPVVFVQICWQNQPTNKCKMKHYLLGWGDEEQLQELNKTMWEISEWKWNEIKTRNEKDVKTITGTLFNMIPN